jgi:hypothetical protein
LYVSVSKTILTLPVGGSSWFNLKLSANFGNDCDIAGKICEKSKNNINLIFIDI